MLITNISRCKGNGERYNIETDGTFWTALYGDTVVKFGITEDVSIDGARKAEIIAYDRALYAKQYSLNLLAVRDLSESKLREKLRSKGIEQEYIEDTAQYLKEMGYLDDERYAFNKAKYLFEVKHYGKMRVKNALVHTYGISRDLAEAAVEDVTASEDFAGDGVLYADMAKHLKGKDIKDRSVIGKAVQKFMRKGFSYEDIKSVVRRITDEVDFLD